MKTLNHKYVDTQKLEAWLSEHEFASCKECLVQFFCGIPTKMMMQKIASVLTCNLPKAHILGTTTDGEIQDSMIHSRETIISVSLFDKTTLSSSYALYNGDSYDMSRELALKLDNSNIKVMISFTTGLNVNGEEYLAAFKDVSQGSYIVSGGLAGDNSMFEQTYVSYQDRIIPGGAVGVVLKSQDLEVKNFYQFGWDALGLPMRVTKSVKNRVYELDNIPILEIYTKYFGSEVADKLPMIGVEIPLILYQDEIRVARACINKFEDGSLLFAGNVTEGQSVRFGIGSIDRILQENETLSEETSSIGGIESTFIYSCMARRHFLGDKNISDLKFIPKSENVSGFYSYGEFHSMEGKNHLLNESLTMLLLSESGFEKTGVKKQIFKDNLTPKHNTLHALTNMTNVMAKEWQEKLDREIAKNKEQGRESFQRNKLAQMGEMIGMIAHQWRQPLNALSATGINLSLLSSMQMLDDKKVQESSEFIQNQCQKMSTTIDTFMNFVKPSQESKGFKLVHTVNAIMEIIETQLINHNIQVSIKVENENLSVVGHEDLLEQVIINILSNARDAFEEIEKADKYIAVSIKSKNSRPTICIEDNAGGVPREIMEKIFNPYFTTKSQGKGTGIGLYMSMNIMKKSFGGDLIYHSKEGGSIFEIVCCK